MRLRNTGAFTLIELLIVIGIISILALLAIPNMLEAQVRAKVSRAKADMRTIATAFESYAVDHNKYVPNYDSGVYPGYAPGNEYLTYAAVTTPIAYITTAPKDPFGADLTRPNNQSYYEYYADEAVMLDASYSAAARDKWLQTGTKWISTSIGPDRQIALVARRLDQVANFIYDPTNGTVSHGDLGRSNVVASLPNH